MLARQCVEPARIAACLKPVPEDDVPEFLWRREPDDDALARLPRDRRMGGESDLRAVIDRLAGSWGYRGWKAGYFDSARDAAAFFDELRWLLLHRRAVPELAFWRHAGLYWAYGIDAAAPDCFVVDYRSGAVRRADQDAVPPSGAVINGVTADATGEGGIWALWRNQARLAELGCTAGVDLAELATGNGDDLAALLAPGMAATGTPGRLTLPATHPQADAFATRNVRAAAAAAAETVGRTIARRHVGALADACAGEGGEAARRFARGAAAQAALPAGMIDRVGALAAAGQADRLTGLLAEDAPPRAATTPGVTVLAIDDAALASAEDPASPAARLLDGAALSGWMDGAAGLHFADTANLWHGCPAAGPVRCAAGDGDVLFLDDTATGRAVLNGAGFLDSGGEFDIGGFRHAAGLFTIGLDIALASASHVTPRIARRAWDYRPISLSLTGLAPLLTGLGIAYDSDSGRATAAGLCALMTGAAYAVSGELATELGAFPGWRENAAAMGAVISRHADADIGGACAVAGLADAARAAWTDARQSAGRDGVRNAQVSAICPAAAESALLDADAPGLAPGGALVRYAELEGGGWRRSADPAVARGLRALGYDDGDVDAALRRLLGHGSLERAPGVNHQALRRRGFSEAAIADVEIRLGEVSDIRQAFDPWLLGENFCTRMLGFTVDEFDDPAFDMLAALGFSDAGIEAANIHCCGAGTLEGAPGLDREHLAVFDGARRRGALGRRSVAPEAVVRMIAAVQPFLSGAVGHTVELPESAAVADFRALLMLGWRLGLKTLTLTRAASETADDGRRPLAHPPLRAVPDGAEIRAAQPISATRAMSQALALAHTAREMAGDGVPEKIIATSPDGAAGDARASRRGSPDSPRSATSVPSSADVVVEQRQV